MAFLMRGALVVAVLAMAALIGCDLSQDMMMDVMTPEMTSRTQLLRLTSCRPWTPTWLNWKRYR